MRVLFTQFLILFLFCGTSAQGVLVTWGPELRNARRTGIGSMISCDGEHYYCLRMHKRAFSTKPIAIEQYSRESMSRDRMKALSFDEVNGVSLKFDTALFLKGNILLFASGYDRGNDR